MLLDQNSVYKQTRLTALNHSQIFNRDDMAPKRRHLYCMDQICRYRLERYKDLRRFIQYQYQNLVINFQPMPMIRIHSHNTPSWMGNHLQHPISRLPHAKLSLFCLKGPGQVGLDEGADTRDVQKKCLYILVFHTHLMLFGEFKCFWRAWTTSKKGSASKISCLNSAQDVYTSRVFVQGSKGLSCG